MADPRGFMTSPRRVAERRPVRADSRLERGVSRHAWAGRAADHLGAGGTLHGLRHPVLPHRVPLGNLIPEWNDLVWRSDWDEALEPACHFRSSPGGCARHPGDRVRSWHQP